MPQWLGIGSSAADRLGRSGCSPPPPSAAPAAPPASCWRAPPTMAADARAGEAALRAVMAVRKELKEAGATRGPFDPEMRRLRAELRTQAEAALLADLRLALVRSFGGLAAAAACWQALRQAGLVGRPLGRRGPAPAGRKLACVAWAAAACRRSTQPDSTRRRRRPSPALSVFCPTGTQRFNVEAPLWKDVYYRPIEEFR